MNITLEIIEESLKEQYQEVQSYIRTNNSKIDYIEILTTLPGAEHVRINPTELFLSRAPGKAQSHDVASAAFAQPQPVLTAGNNQYLVGKAPASDKADDSLQKTISEVRNIVLYVCDPSEISDEALNGLSNLCQFILTADDPRFSGFDRIILPNVSVTAAYSKALQLVNNMHIWEQKLLDAVISRCDIQDLVDICEAYFQNEVVIYDASGYVIAFTKLFLSAEGLQYWKKLEQSWYLDFNDISSKCRVPNLLSNVDLHSAKYLRSNVVNKRAIIQCYVYENNTWFACITVTEMNRPLKKADLAMTNLLAKCVLSVLKRDLQNSEPLKTPEYEFLNDAVMSKPMSTDLVSHMLKLFGWRTKGSYGIFVIGHKLLRQTMEKQFELCKANLARIAPHYKVFLCEDFITAIANEPAHPKTPRRP